MTLPHYLKINSATRHVSLNASDPAFYGDPNVAYAALHAHCPTFYWEEQKQWFCCNYDLVNSLLRRHGQPELKSGNQGNDEQPLTTTAIQTSLLSVLLKMLMLQEERIDRLEKQLAGRNPA